MLFLSDRCPPAMRAAVAGSGWTKASFSVTSLIGKTQVVWVYQATCKLSNLPVALKCYRKDQQSAINHQYAPVDGHSSEACICMYVMLCRSRSTHIAQYTASALCNPVIDLTLHSGS
jgi:hypothetical protein